MSRKTPHDVFFAIIVLLALGPIVFIVDRACEHEAAIGAEYQRWAAQDRLGRSPSHVVVEAEFSRHGDDTGLDASRIWQELCAQSGARAVSADQDVASRGRSVLEAGGNGALWFVLECNALLAVMNDVVEAFAENAAQRDAAHRQLAVDGLAA